MAPPTEVIERIESGSLPGAPNLGLPPTPGQPGDLRARLDTEYVAGGDRAALTNYLRTLPAYVDDVTRDFGDDLYDRMLLDPHIAADVDVLKASILETGLTFSPAKPDRDDDGHDLSVEIADSATRMFDEMATPSDDVLWDMADAIATGNRVAELVYRLDSTYTGRTQLVLDRMVVKPRRATAFVADTFFNVVGLLGRVPGQGAPVQTGTLIGDAGNVPNLLPREKFAVWTHRPKNHDPRGTSALRPVYNVWWLKAQLWGQYLKYLTQFAGPSLAGFTAPAALPVVPTDGNGNPTGAPTLSPEQAMLNQLLEFQNGTAAAFPYGAALQTIFVQGGEQAFLSAFALLNAEITKGILHQSLATEEGKHSTRAAAGVHKDILDTLVRQGKNSIIRMIRFDVLRNWVRWNYGEKAVALVPTVGLGEIEREDFAANMTAVSDGVKSGFIHRSQFVGFDEFLGNPPRDPEWENDPGPEITQVSSQRTPAAVGEGLPPAPAVPAPAPAAPETKAA